MEDDDYNIDEEFRDFKENSSRASSLRKTKEVIVPAFVHEEVKDTFTGFSQLNDLLIGDQLKEVFDFIDSNKDGLITKDQIAFFLNFLNMEATPAEIDQMLDICDPKIHGKPDFEAFQNMLKSVFPLAHSMIPTQQLKSTKHAVQNICENNEVEIILTKEDESLQDQQKIITDIVYKLKNRKQDELSQLQEQQPPKKETKTILPLHAFKKTKSNRTSDSLRLLKKKFMLFYEEFLDLDRLFFMIETAKPRLSQMLKPKQVSELFCKKHYSVKPKEVQSLAQAFLVPSEQLVNLKEFLACFIGVAGLDSTKKLSLGLQLLGRTILFEELNQLIAWLMFSVESPLQSKLKMIYRRKLLGERVEKQKILELFDQYSGTLIV